MRSPPAEQRRLAPLAARPTLFGCPRVYPPCRLLSSLQTSSGLATGAIHFFEFGIDHLIVAAWSFRACSRGLRSLGPAEGLIHSSEKSLGEYGEKIGEAERNAITEAIAALKTAAEGDDADAINAATQTLAEVSMKLGQAMYEASQKEAAEADAKADAAKDSDVVDADFEEIDEDDDKKKSA